jgi:type VI secretion system protein VasG
MSLLDAAGLVDSLHPLCRQALECAAQRSKRSGHPWVGIEHLLIELTRIERGDLTCLLPHFDLTLNALASELEGALAKLQSGHTKTPHFVPQLLTLLQDAFVLCRASLKAPALRSGMLLLALLENESHRALLQQAAPSLLGISTESLRTHLIGWTVTSAEAAASTKPMGTHAHTSANEPSPHLDLYTQDLTELARTGRMDPIVGRDHEIRQCIDILLRRRQNNPILVGEPGVGKTAVVEGLALRIAANDVPPSLQNVAVRVLDLGLLQAGAGVKGEFESRLKGVMDEVRQAAQPIILFIDEAHTMVGAGAAEGQNDAANLLKPALARGELRTIAATTWLEYKKYFEKDAALARRFQLIQVDEPSETVATEMLRGIATRLELHHQVRVLDAAIVDAVKLSHRYISGRQLPDKAISVLDTACARVALAQHDVPPPIEQLRHRRHALREELARLQGEQMAGADHGQRIAALAAEQADNQVQCHELEVRWQEQREAVCQILNLREQLDSVSLQRELDEDTPQKGAATDEDTEDDSLSGISARLARLESGLEALRQDDPLVPLYVDSRVVAQVIEGWTGIPMGKMLADEIHAVRTLAQRMAQRVVGQNAALGRITQRIQAYRAGLSDPGKPVGVFLLVGPTGVGKTETAYALADALYGGERNLVTINLAEYQEAHTVSQLKGAPPGYVGYGSGGVLTEAVRRKPYCVVLLDEIEKAHPDVLEAFYNVFDKGVMEDGTGLVVDFKNTVILATSNVGAELIQDTPQSSLATDRFADQLRPELLKAFRAAFLARMTVVPYRSLDDATLGDIVRAKLEKLQQRYKTATGKRFEFDERIVSAVLTRCRAAGARDVDNVLMSEVVGQLAQWVLE